MVSLLFLRQLFTSGLTTGTAAAGTAWALEKLLQASQRAYYETIGSFQTQRLGSVKGFSIKAARPCPLVGFPWHPGQYWSSSA